MKKRTQTPARIVPCRPGAALALGVLLAIFGGLSALIVPPGATPAAATDAGEGDGSGNGSGEGDGSGNDWGGDGGEIKHSVQLAHERVSHAHLSGHGEA